MNSLQDIREEIDKIISVKGQLVNILGSVCHVSLLQLLSSATLEQKQPRQIVGCGIDVGLNLALGL